MSSVTEDATQVRNLILELFTHAGQGDFKTENAHEFYVKDVELQRGKHALYAVGMLTRLPGGMVEQEYGKPWFFHC